MEQTIRGFEIRVEGGTAGTLDFVDAMRERITRTQAKDTDTMVLRAGGPAAMLMGMLGIAAYLIVTRNDALANILSDTLGFTERDDMDQIGTMLIDSELFADDGSLATKGFIEGVQSDMYDEARAEVNAEREEAAARAQASTEDVKVLTDDGEEIDPEDFDDDFEDEDDDDDWDDDDDFEDDDDWDDDEDYED